MNAGEDEKKAFMLMLPLVYQGKAQFTNAFIMGIWRKVRVYCTNITEPQSYILVSEKAYREVCWASAFAY